MKYPELKKYAKSKGVNFTQVAQAMHVHPSTVYHWIRNPLHPARYKLIVCTINRIAAQKSGAQNEEVTEDGKETLPR